MRTAVRKTTLAKLARDAENIRRYARFAIVLDESSGDIEVIDNGIQRDRGLPYVSLIGVLGEEGILLEVGFSRARPYGEVRKRLKDGTRHSSLIRSRERARFLSEEEITRVYPHIVECMTTIVCERREKWETKGAWHVKGPGFVERGIYFTIHSDDEPLHSHFMREDARWRKEKYIARHASWVRQLCKKYSSSSHSPKKLKSLANVRRIAELLMQDHYAPFHRTILLRCFDEGSHERSLLDTIVKAFNIDTSITDLEANVLESTSICLPELVNLRYYRIPDQPKVYARNATVFEIVLEENYRKQLEMEMEDANEEVPF